MNEQTRGDEIWASDDERKLFVRAVQRYSHQCEPPALTPECPFYELSSSGDPVCAEQCMDLIARHSEDLVRPDVTDLGAGLDAIRRPRPRSRRGPDPDARPFDAKELRLSESGPLESWRTPSLMLELRDQVMFPEHDPAVDVRQVVDELNRRGIDVDKLVRLGMTPNRLTSLVVQMAMQAREEGGSSPVVDLMSAYHEANGTMPAGPPVSDVPYFALLTPELFQSLRACLQRSTLDEALSGALPTVEQLLSSGLPPISGDEVGDQIWLLERFTETFVSDWKHSSLMREWKYIHAMRRGCCPAGLMSERQVDRDDLAFVISEAAVSDWAERDEGPTWPGGEQIGVSSFASIAYRDVYAGRSANSAALYRGLAELRPDSVEVRNNLGFCLLPDDPKSAVEQFEICLELAGESVTAMHLLNLALARHRSGDQEGALEALERSLEAENLSMPVTMWVFDGDGLRPEHFTQAGNYALELEAHLVNCAGC